MVLFTFSVLDQKHPFCANLVQKSKLFKLTFNTKTNSNKQNSMVVFTFSVLDETPFLGKFGPKSQNCQFKLKFGTLTNSDMQN